MHIHNQPVNLYSNNVYSPATVAVQRAAEIRRRLARAASKLSEESNLFNCGTVSQTSGEAPRRQQSRDRPGGAKALSAEEEEPTGTFSLHA